MEIYISRNSDLIGLGWDPGMDDYKLAFLRHSILQSRLKTTTLKNSLCPVHHLPVLSIKFHQDRKHQLIGIEGGSLIPDKSLFLPLSALCLCLSLFLSVCLCRHLSLLLPPFLCQYLLVWEQDEKGGVPLPTKNLNISSV